MPGFKACPGADNRKLALGIPDAIARDLDIEALRPSPHPGGGEAKGIEARRLARLGGQGVRFRNVLGESQTTQLRSDLGDTGAGRPRAAAGDCASIAGLTAAVFEAIAAAHARGAHFGQPLPRNITFDDASAWGLSISRKTRSM